jgi:HAD superfamily hydrolase (TIGR01509 family)
MTDIAAVVFDFDGVIANSEPLHYRGFRDVLHAEQIALPEPDYYARYLGFDDAGTFRAVSRDRDLAWDEDRVATLVERKAARMEELEQGGSILFPGAESAIRRLAAHVPLAIASGALRAEIERILQQSQLARYFAAIVAAEDTPRSKPAPDPYLRAVSLLGTAVGRPLLPAECVAIEDSRWGLESARLAGLRTIAVTHTYPAEELSAGADMVIATLDALDLARLGSIATS